MKNFPVRELLIITDVIKALIQIGIGSALARRGWFMPHRTEIDYSQPAMYARSEAGAWMSFGPMPLREAVLLAVRKYRVNHEACIFSQGISLVGIDAIIAVFRRPDFPSPDLKILSEETRNHTAPRRVIAPVDRAKRVVLTEQFGREQSRSRPNVSVGDPLAPSRELITNGDNRFVGGENDGRFSAGDNVGRSRAAERRGKAKIAAVPGQGDKGDRKR